MPGTSHPQCGGSWRRVPAGQEGSSQAAPSGPSKVSCLPQESSAPPALVSLCHCPALEVICCFINYLHTMGPLSLHEQHTLAFRSNALTSAHPGQTKCLCAAFPLLGPAPTPTSAPRPDRPRPRPPQPGGTHGTPRCAGPATPRVRRSFPQEAWPSPAGCPSRMDGTGHWSRGLALSGAGWRWVPLLRVLPSPQGSDASTATCVRGSELPRVCRWTHGRKPEE